MQVIEQLKALDEEHFLALYEGLAQNGFGPLDGEVAKALKFRPQAIRKLPMQQRARKARQILLSRSQADATYEVFGAHLMRHHKELVTGFLDGTGVPHEDGMISDLENAQPDPEKVAPVVAELDGKFSPVDVTLYLSLCAQQWPENEAIQKVWRARLETAVGS